MQEVFEKIIEKLEDIPVLGTFPTEVLQDAINVVEQVAKDYNNGWITVEERLPSFEERQKSYCRNAYGAEFIVMIEGGNSTDNFIH